MSEVAWGYLSALVGIICGGGYALFMRYGVDWYWYRKWYWLVLGVVWVVVVSILMALLGEVVT